MLVAAALAAALLGAAPAGGRAAAYTECAAQPAVSATASASFDALWSRHGPGWTGGDGARSLLLPDGRVLWAFGDTFLGTVADDGSRANDTPLVRNSFVIQDGACLETHVGGSPEHPSDLVTPEDSSHWFWPGKPIVSDGAVEVVMGEWHSTADGWFAHDRDWIARFSLPDLALKSLTPLPAQAGVSWAESVVVDGDWTYVYGLELRPPPYKALVVARVPTGRLASPADWRFGTADGWSPDAGDAQPLVTGLAGADVIPVDEGFAMLAQDQPMFATSEIYLYRSSSPAGPWTRTATLATIPAPEAGVYSYGAEAHPEFDDGGRLLVGYSVNAFALPTLYADASSYRPRFLSVPLPREDGHPRIDAVATAGGAPYRPFTWSRTPVTVRFDCQPADGATVVSVTAPQLLANDGSGQVVDGRCTDSEGRTSTLRFGPVRIDQTPPPSPDEHPDRSPDAGGWYRDSVRIATEPASADPAPADGTLASGIDAAAVPPDQLFSASGDFLATAPIADRAGNASAAALRVRVDADPPQVTAACPARQVLADHRAVARWRASDGQSGLASPAAGAVPLDTSTPGEHAASTPPVRDGVGHERSATCVYSVAPDTTGPRLRVARRRIRVRGDGEVPLRLRCPSAEPAGCRGRAALRVAGRRSPPVPFGIAAGASRRVSVTLPAAAGAALARAGHLRARVTLRAWDQRGNVRVASIAARLDAPR